jgi:protein required for attachment to host cells
MEQLKIPRHAYVLVCDGAKALLFRNDGDAELINLQSVEQFAEPLPPARDLAADRPGRVFQSVGSARSAVEETDFHEEGEALFLAELAKDIERIVRDEKVQALFVAAPPKALGILRKHYGNEIKGALKHEIAKDFAHLPTHEIEKHLAG